MKRIEGTLRSALLTPEDSGEYVVYVEVASRDCVAPVARILYGEDRVNIELFLSEDTCWRGSVDEFVARIQRSAEWLEEATSRRGANGPGGEVPDN
jgi:hypothetical protein